MTFQRNAANTPVTLLATGDVTIAGTISLDGAKGGRGINTGGLGGPGGFNGGTGILASGVAAAGGQGPGGGAPGNPGTYGAPSSFQSLLPLFGGSGAGGATFRPSSSDGASGGGGGGAIVMASSSKITLTGTVRANGANRNEDNTFAGCGFVGYAGAGGSLRMVAPHVTGSGGNLSARGGQKEFSSCTLVPGGDGRVRIEAFETTGLSVNATPLAIFSAAAGPVTPASTPALANLPTLTITAVAGTAAPTTPTGSYTTADVSLPPGTTNPISMTLTATNIPVGIVFTVRLIPQSGSPTTVSSTQSSGTFENATATASVNFPLGQVSLLNAYASFTLPQLASLFPNLDGEPADRILVATAQDGASSVSLVTDAGTLVPVEALSYPERVRLALAIQDAGTHGP